MNWWINSICQTLSEQNILKSSKMNKKKTEKNTQSYYTKKEIE